VWGIFFCALSGCASQRRVVVGLSPHLEDYYAMYPAIEFDIVAVTGEEADQIKKDGVDKYFALGSPLRKRLDPFRLFAAIESGDTVAAAEFSRLAHEVAVTSGYTSSDTFPLTKEYDVSDSGVVANPLDPIPLSVAHVTAIADVLEAQLNAPSAPGGAPDPGGGAT
jgi:hypothetical protein